MEISGSLAEKNGEDHPQNKVVSGEYVLHMLLAEFTVQVDKKFDALLDTEWTSLSVASSLKDRLTKSLQRGEDSQFDQLLSSLGCVAEHCLPSLLDTLFKWYEHQLPNTKRPLQKESSSSDGKQHKSSTKSKSDSIHFQEDFRLHCREMAVEFVFCLVLIEVLRQLPVHPLPDRQIRSILTYAFSSFHRAAEQKTTDPVNSRIVADLYAEAIGVLAQTKFQPVRMKFMYELLKERDKDPPTNTILSLIMGMKYFRVKMYPIEDFEASFRFLQELANYSLDVKNREIKHALAGLFVEILLPVAAAVKTEVNVPVLRDFVDSLYPTCLELSKRQKNKLAMYPLVTCLLCVSQKQFFLNNWHIFLDNCLSTLKKNDQKLSRIALESLYRLLWVYMVRIKCESNIATQSRLQSIVKSLFPVGSRNVVPKDTPLNIFVKIIQFIAQERLDFAMKEIILDLLSISLSGSRSTKPITIHPERMNIGLRAFLIIADSLQQKDGAPPMPSTAGVMPSGNTLRVKKTFLNKTLTEDEARTIGVSHYHKHVQKALDGILQALDNQVGQRMMMTNSQLSNKDPQDLLTGDHKPKVELFRTCIAAIPRLMPTGMAHSDLLEMLSRLTVHIDEELRGRAFSALQSFAVDFPTLREEVVATFLSFVLKQVSDVHQVLLDGALRMLVSLITAWKNNPANTKTDSSPSSRLRNKAGSHNFHNTNSSLHTSSGKSVYAPIINRVEGFALVLLCSSRSVTRKLACHILKEIRALAHTLEYGKQDDALCLDILDGLCPEVARDVMTHQTALNHLDGSERDTVLAAASKQDVTTLVECSSSWHEQDGLHPWIMFMASFIESSRLLKFCPTAISYSWPDVYIRLSQLHQHIDPTSTSGSKKTVPAPVSNESLMLWSNYLVFACKCSPSNLFIKQKQMKESAIAAGTSDWQVKLTQDPERVPAVPSSLFQRLITQLRAEGSPAHREAAVIGLGSTSVVAFSDLMTELVTIIHEASETKKQENVRRKKKRESVRVLLAKVFARLASHKVLSEGILAELEKPVPIGSTRCKPIIEDYIEEMRALLDSMESLNTSSFNVQGSSQMVNNFTTNSPGQSVTGYAALASNELQLNFGEMIIQLIRHMPLERRAELMTPATRKQLFDLFEKWCKRFVGIQLSDQSLFEGVKNSDSTALLYTALRAECSVLCCGPVFEKRGFEKNGHLYDWLVSLLDCANANVHKIGREAVVLLLHFNSDIPLLLSWLIDKCYTGSNLVATGCFLGIAAQFANCNYRCGCISMLSLALYKIGDPDPEVSQTAEHLFIILLTRFFSSQESGGNLAGSRRNSGTFKSSNRLIFAKFDLRPEKLHSQSQIKLSEELARAHPEISLPMLSEIFRRFPTASYIGRRQMLEFMQPWLQNIELTHLASPSAGSSFDGSFHHTLGSSSTTKGSNSQNHSWLPMEGWGSQEATMLVLNNLTYITTCYHATLGPELEQCWVTMRDTWPRNMSVCLEFLFALHSLHISEALSRASRLVISYLSRSKSSRVIRSLIKDCQLAEPVSTVIEESPKAPYYKVVNVVQEFHINSNGAPERKSSPSNGRYPKSKDGQGESSEAENSSDRYQTSHVHSNFTSVSPASSVVLTSHVNRNQSPSSTARIKPYQPLSSPFTMPKAPTASILSPQRSRFASLTPGRLLAPGIRNQPHHLSLQQLNAISADDEFSEKPPGQTASSPPSSGGLRFMRGKTSSRKARPSSNMSSMPSVLFSSMHSLNTNTDLQVVNSENASNTLSHRLSSPPGRLKFRYSHHEPSTLSSSSKLLPKFASTRELSTRYLW